MFRNARAPKFLSYFEGNIEKTGGDFLTTDGPSYADLALFHVYDGVSAGQIVRLRTAEYTILIKLLFAFPNLMAKLGPNYPLVVKLYKKVKAAPRIAAYLSSTRRQPYSHGIFRLYPELDLQA